MNQELILEALRLSQLGDNQSIRKAEDIMQQGRQNPDLVKELMIIANGDQFAGNARVSAICALHNEVKYSWEEIAPVGKSFLRNNILDSINLTSQIKPIRKTYKQLLRRLITENVITEWPNLTTEILNKLKTAQTQTDLIGPLLAIEQLLLCFRDLINDERAHLNQITTSIFPYICNIAGNQMNNNDETSLRILKICLRCFLQSNWLQIDPYFNSEQLRNWMVLIKTVLDRELTVKHNPETWEDILDASKTLEWKNKILATEITARMIYLVNFENSSNQITKIQEEFIELYAQDLVKVCWNYTAYAEKMFIAPKAVYNSLIALNYAVQNHTLGLKLNGCFEQLLLDVCIPLMKLNKKDQEYWESDEKEFIYANKSTNTREDGDHASVRREAIRLARRLTKYKAPDGEPLSFKFVNFFAFTFKTGKNVRSGDSLDPASVEALLTAMEAVFSRLKKHQKIVDGCEELVKNIILEHLKSEYGQIRCRAFAVLSQMGGIFLDDIELYKEICFSICRNLKDQKLPVRVEATQALGILLMHKDVRELLRPDIEQILMSVFGVMQEIEHTAVVEALQAITTSYGNSMGQWAVQLINSFAEAFKKYRDDYAKKNRAMEDEAVKNPHQDLCEELEAALSCLDSITNILRAKLDPRVYTEISDTMLDLLNCSLLSGDGDAIEKCFSFLNTILYKSESLNDTLTFYYPIITYLITGKPKNKSFQLDINNLPKVFQQILRSDEVLGQQLDSFESMIGCFLNYMAKSGETFLTSTDFYGTSFTDLLFGMVKVIGEQTFESKNYTDLCAALRLIIGLIENFRGQIDDLIPRILEMVWELKCFAGNGSLKSILVQVICMLFWYDPQLTMKLVNEGGKSQAVLGFLFENVGSLSRDFEKEKELYGIAGILSLPQNLFPDFLSLGSIAKEVLKISTEILELRGGEKMEEDYGELEFEEGVKIQDDSSRILHLMERDNSEGSEWSEDPEVMDFGGIYLAYDSPLEKTCPITLVEEVFKGMESSNSGYFNNFIGCLTSDEQDLLLNNFKTAQEELNEKLRFLGH